MDVTQNVVTRFYHAGKVIARPKHVSIAFIGGGRGEAGGGGGLQPPTFFMGCRTSYFILPVLKIIFIILGRGFTSNDASKENNRIIFYGFIKAELSTYWKSNYRADEWGGGLIKMEWPISFSAPPPPTFYFAPPRLGLHPTEQNSRWLAILQLLWFCNSFDFEIESDCIMRKCRFQICMLRQQDPATVAHKCHGKIIFINMAVAKMILPSKTEGCHA